MLFSSSPLLPRRTPQYIRHSIIRRLPHKILPPQRSVAISGEAVRNPTYWVPKIPHRNAHTPLLIHTRPRSISIHLRLHPLRRPIPRQRQPNIQFRQRRVQSKRTIQRLRGTHVRIRRCAADGEMRLQAHAVDGDLAFLEVLDEGLDGERFVVHALDAVVVVVKFCAGGGVFTGIAEGGFDVCGANGVEPDCAAEGAVVLYICQLQFLQVGMLEEEKEGGC
jgi:hypothetical protein